MSDDDERVLSSADNHPIRQFGNRSLFHLGIQYTRLLQVMADGVLRQQRGRQYDACSAPLTGQVGRAFRVTAGTAGAGSRAIMGLQHLVVVVQRTPSLIATGAAEIDFEANAGRHPRTLTRSRRAVRARIQCASGRALIALW